MNTDDHKKMVGRYNPKIDISTLSRAAIFSITYPSSDVFLVIKLEKVFQQGDISEAADPYIKETDQSKVCQSIDICPVTSVLDWGTIWSQSLKSDLR